MPRRVEEPPTIEVSAQTKADFAKVVFDKLQAKLDKKNARYGAHCSTAMLQTVHASVAKPAHLDSKITKTRPSHSLMLFV